VAVAPREAFVLLSPLSSPVSGRCPVRPSRKALPGYTAVHAGRTVGFCCEDCREAFLADPAKYAGPAGQRMPSTAIAEPPTVATPVMAWLIPLAILAVLLGRRPRRLDWRSAARVSAATLAIVAGVAVARGIDHASTDGRIATMKGRLDDLDAIADIHFATFQDFGQPPVPVHPGIPRRLGGVFYRGNDERDPRLFNGGHYRTATFRLSLVSATTALVPGDAVSGKPIAVRLRIERAPFTPDFFWEERAMAPFFLTRENTPFIGRDRPPADRVSLTTLAPMQRWEGVYALGTIATGDARLNGLIYLCQQYPKGARFHYGIAYDLHVVGGRIAADSDVWMGALYRTRKVLPHKLPLSEWFSARPIPTKPGPGPDDERLLGIEVDPLAPAHYRERKATSASPRGVATSPAAVSAG
jgi:hypothetical protein